MFTLICKQCGQPFSSTTRSTKFCSRACYGVHRMLTRKSPPRETPDKGKSQTDLLFESFAASKRREVEEQRQRRERQRRRDIAFEAWELENGFADRIVETETTRTVIRGNVCIGGRASNFVNHNA